MIKAKEIIDYLRLFCEDEARYFYQNPSSNYWHYGWVQRLERIPAIAALAVRKFPGDIVEIGCASGLMTVKLAEIARRNNRQVIAIDPWQRDLKDGISPDFEGFLKRTEKYKGTIEVSHCESQDETVIESLKKRTIAFALVDGKHTYEAALSDIGAVYHAGVICTDECLWDWPMLRAVHEGAGQRQKIRHPFCKEGYVV